MWRCRTCAAAMDLRVPCGDDACDLRLARSARRSAQIEFAGGSGRLPAGVTFKHSGNPTLVCPGIRLTVQLWLSLTVD